MSEIVRLSMSLEADLLKRFDRYCKDGQFATRSEAIRQLLHEALTNQSWADDAQDAVGTLTLVFDHHRSNLVQEMLEVQHRHPEIVVSTIHTHLDHDNCLEVIILRGRAGDVQKLASELKGLKGVKKGQLVIATADDEGHRHSHSHGHSHSHTHD